MNYRITPRWEVDSESALFLGFSQPGKSEKSSRDQGDLPGSIRKAFSEQDADDDDVILSLGKPRSYDQHDPTNISPISCRWYCFAFPS